MKISTEEAFVPPVLIEEWRKLLAAGAPGEPGFELLIGPILDPVSDWEAMLLERLPELGPLRLQAMDESGVDMQLIFLSSPGVQPLNADRGGALAAEANDTLIEAVNAHPTRFAGLAAIQPQAPETAARELERAVGLGLKGAVVNSHSKGEYLDSPIYRPILEAAVHLDVPIYLHPRTVPPAMVELFAERHMEGAFWGFQTETALHMLRLMVSGVFDDLPGLKIVVGHLGEGVPFWLDRLDRQYHRGQPVRERFPHWHAKRLPSEYFLENFFITSSGHNWDPAVRFVEEVVGEDRLMFAIDYPYANCNQQTQQAAAIELANEDKFYHLNAKRIFRLD
ncbi:MAG: amidohydrolase family protein [Rhodospirillales bacterium]|jgi:2,3-dihydroxybenzoate decarboxylase|nr:amidohydrolase [Rhodospirillaceae bacterium]MDP6429892.1 amidohydrolase family protein [Rhodospirillales bacterium]MDP6644117.1 amidohydrolase family protein [Rhodospirillales bacterium]MDP6843392.1 amidohydrolase family protein [Rhodospirillales bacterium]